MAVLMERHDGHGGGGLQPVVPLATASLPGHAEQHSVPLRTERSETPTATPRAAETARPSDAAELPAGEGSDVDDSRTLGRASPQGDEPDSDREDPGALQDNEAVAEPSTEG